MKSPSFKRTLLCLMKIGILILICSSITKYFRNQHLTYDFEIFDSMNPRASIIIDPIFIDGDDGDNDWNIFPNKTGSGTFVDPYIIANFEIDAGGIGSGIYIRDSYVYAEIKYCDSSNSGGSTEDAGIRLENCHNIKIIDCISNNHANYGIYLNSSSNNSLSGNDASENLECGIYLDSSSNNTLSGNDANFDGPCGIWLKSSNNNTLFENIANNNDDGICLAGSSNNTLTGNDVLNNIEYGIILGQSSNNTLSGNDARLTGSGIYLAGSSNNTLSENRVSNNGYGIHLKYSSNYNTLSGNDASNNDQYGIYLDSWCDNNTISGNDASNNGQYGIYLQFWSDNNTLSGNDVTYNQYGILLDSSSNNTVFENNASYNSIHGIFLSSSSNNTVSWNKANNNSCGFWLDSSSNNTVSWNNASYNSNLGIFLGSSSNNTVSENNASYNSIHGISLSSSSNHLLSGNDVSYNCKYGIKLFSSSNNTLSGNIMIDSGIRFEDSIQNNVDKTNLVNNKPIYYYENRNDVRLNESDLAVGQLIFINCNNSVVSNLGLSNCSVGMHIEYSYNNTFFDNIVNNASEYGIFILSSHNNTFMNNKIEYGKTGVDIFDGTYNNFYRNAISYSIECGMYIIDGSNSNFIDNTFSHFDASAIAIMGSDNNFIGNTISYSTVYGLAIGGSNNDIWGNILIENIIPAYDNGVDNNWDNGTHGNYWGDFQSQYPSANAMGLIWDTLYEIGGSSGTWDNFPLVFSPIPEAPTILTLDQTITVKNITIQWNKIPGVEYYRIYVDEILNITTEETAYDIQLLNDGTYEITVCAISWYCESQPSSSLFITVEIPPVPDAPTWITNNQTILHNNITVSWNSVAGATSYRLYVNGVLNETTSSTSQQIWLHVNGTYFITITALNASGESEYSIAITIIAEILPVFYLPDVPTWITGNQLIPYNNIIVSWNTVFDATSYRIYVNGSLNETTSSTSQQIWLHVNGTFSITVTALNANGESDYSTAIIIIVKIPPTDAGDDTTDDTWVETEPWYSKPWVWSAIGAGATVTFGAIGIMKKTGKKPGDLIKRIVNRRRK